MRVSWETNLGTFHLEDPTPEQLEAIETLGFETTLTEE